MKFSTLVELAVFLLVAATVMAYLDITVGIEIVDRAIDLLDVRQYV